MNSVDTILINNMAQKLTGLSCAFLFQRPAFLACLAELFEADAFEDDAFSATALVLVAFVACTPAVVGSLSGITD